MLKAFAAGVALLGAIAVNTIYEPPSRAHCTNKFIDRPDCPGAPKACGLAIDRDLCPDRDLTREEIVQLEAIPIEKRPPWHAVWNVPKY